MYSYSETLTSLLFIELLKVIKIRCVSHVLDIDGYGRRSVSDMLPICPSEEMVVLQILHLITKTILTVTHQPTHTVIIYKCCYDALTKENIQ